MQSKLFNIGSFEVTGGHAAAFGLGAVLVALLKG